MIKAILISLLVFAMHVQGQTISAGYLCQLTNDKDYRIRQGLFAELYFNYNKSILGSNLSNSISSYEYNVYNELNGSFIKTDSTRTISTNLTSLSVFFCKNIFTKNIVRGFLGPELGISLSTSTGYNSVNSYRPLIGLKIKLKTKDFFDEHLGLDFGFSPIALIKTGEALDAEYTLTRTTFLIDISTGIRYKF